MFNKYAKRLRRGLKAKAIQKRAKHNNKPRLVVYRSVRNIYVQVVVQAPGGNRVIVSCSTKDKEIRSQLNGNKVEQAFQVGKLLAVRALAEKIQDVAFDRSGYHYHGRVRAVADGAREAGLSF